MGIDLILEMAVATDADRVLVGPREGGLTASQLWASSGNGAAHLLARGARSVAFIGVNGPALPVTVLASARAGLPVTPLNYRLTREALLQQLSRLDHPLVVADADLAPDDSAGLDVMTTADWMAATSGEGPGADLPVVDDDAVAVTLFTSGTTSTPKAVLLRHRNLLSYVLQTVELGSADPADAALVSVPPYHIAGIGTILTNLYAGRRVVHLPGFSPAAWLDTVRSEKVRSAMLVPTMLTRIVEHLAGRAADVPTLHSIAYGGAKMSRPALELALRAFPDVDFTNAYGLTETSSTIAVLTPDDHRAALASTRPEVRDRLASAGRFVPGVEGVVRSLDGETVPPGDTGELWVRGPQVSGEYEGLGSTLDDDGWFPTRDLAHIDDDGYLFIHGRSDDTIIRGGENIAPAEIEDVLVEHPALADVAVVGVSDDDWGHRIRAVVVIRQDHQVSETELRDWVRARLRGSRTPDEVVFAVDLPYSPTGKLLRSQLIGASERSHT